MAPQGRYQSINSTWLGVVGRRSHQQGQRMSTGGWVGASGTEDRAGVLVVGLSPAATLPGTWMPCSTRQMCCATDWRGASSRDRE